MIIKRYDGSNFVVLFPKTTTTRLFNNTGTTSVFDSNDKINPNFLPNSIFDSLYFFTTIGANTNLATLAGAAISNATTRSALGYYWVINANISIAANTGASQIGSNYFVTSFVPSEEGNSISTGTANLEIGDWIVITGITGDGSVSTPYNVSFAVVNNTYEIMLGASSSADGVPGLVPGPLVTNRFQFLRGDGT